jgi:hypothetical protein
MANWIDKGLLGDFVAYILAHDAFQDPSLHPPSRNPTPLAPPPTLRYVVIPPTDATT